MRTLNVANAGRPVGLIAALLVVLLSSSGDVASTVWAQEATPNKAALTDGQKDVAGRFSRLEDLLLRSADLEAGENPTRAALLQQAVQLSKQAQLADQLAKAASNLESKQYSEAIELQKSSRESLKQLLELLQSENREERVREKRDQVRRWIEETDRLLRLQSSLRGRTEGGQETQQAAGDQDKLAQKAEEIASELKGEQSTASDASGEKGQEGKEQKASAGDPPPDASNNSEAKDAEAKDAEAKDAEAKDAEANGEKPPSSEADDAKASQDPQESDSDATNPASKDKTPNADPKAGDASKSPSNDSPAKDSPAKESSQSPSGESQQGESQQGESQQGESESGGQEQPPQSNDPTERARQRIEQAKERMKEAQAELEKAQREGAVQKQLEAENNLREAIEELQEILRQLREEEIERSLASLETRLRRMLEMQIRVRDESKRLQDISGDQAVRQVEIRASTLSRDERKILAEGQRAYLLLLEEGSSAAFPEAITQVNADIAKVAERLDAADVGQLTLVIEEEIVISLEEMVAALVQVQKDNQEKQKQQQQAQQQQQGQPGDQPLVDKLAEIRLIRTLQIRINNRTEALSKMLADPTDPVGQVAEGEVLEELRGLSERQASIQTVTRDIVIGKGE
jgi:hypothetical protein